MDTDREKVDRYVTDCSSVLVLAPHRSTADDEACMDLLTKYELEETNLLSITVSETPDERLALWQHEVGETLPKRATLVDAGTHPVAASQTAASEDVPSLSVDTLPADAEPIDVGMAIARHLSTWESNQESTLLCLHSLTTLIDTFGRKRVLSLVRGLNDLSDCLDVMAHHHMDPTAHSAETIATFRPHYDAVVEHVPDHGWAITDDTDVESPSSRRSTATQGTDHRQTAARSAIVPVPYSLDTVLDLLSAARRRTLLYQLRDNGGSTAIPLDQLVEQIRAREATVSARQSLDSLRKIRISIAHTHLPKLEDAGIVTYDTDMNVVEYSANPALESCLEYVETLESL